MNMEKNALVLPSKIESGGDKGLSHLIEDLLDSHRGLTKQRDMILRMAFFKSGRDNDLMNKLSRYQDKLLEISEDRNKLEEVKI